MKVAGSYETLAITSSIIRCINAEHQHLKIKIWLFLPHIWQTFNININI